ncbi:MAG: hypothetical protein QOH62_3010 [Solirubrobacteraceae bacterium]|jgi:uncharacterized membrane protein|nr:hypothetical protein [Solirubrobacteraceae bacterium]
MAVDERLDPGDYFAEEDRRERERLERRARRAARVRRPRRRTGEAGHLSQTPAGRWLIGLNVAIAAATLIGLVALWPGAVHHHGPSQAFGGPTQTTTVTGALNARCPGPTPQTCRVLEVHVGGSTERMTLGPVNTVPKVGKGDRVRISHTQLQPGVKRPAGYEDYQLVDLERQGSMLWIALLLAVLAIAVLRVRGLLAFAGVGLSVLVLTKFVVPAILTGESALLVALVGSLAVMFVTLVLTNGIGAQTFAAALGITATLGLLGLLAPLFIGFAHLDGHSTDLSLVLTQQNSSLSLQGVVLAGMVIGGLGVLADTAVTQASAVMALRRADPELTARGLYHGAFTVGRDHLSATIHTLVLAYAGASLPLLLVLRSSGLGFHDALNAQDIAEPVVATLVGCIGLVAAVPLTTGLASLLVSRLPPVAIPDGHGHHH